ncbi:putative helicase MOV-10 isoform X2 [Toxorhynchites rutilus septentrionalis]|uniref:putative helicase MOV-10 isoform X2 n=1 Tax=Toxorhynchites rutilus septentrionalis TaxID=329112 RepID=UPI002479A566|nr:putative helicase MOV-10 isoform X2 [Toxorhynchites rutilus septentrionalis]
MNMITNGHLEIQSQKLKRSPATDYFPKAPNDEKSVRQMKELSQPKSKQNHWKLRHIRTFTRNYQELEYTPRSCYICRLNFADDARFRAHRERHGSEFRTIRQLDDCIEDEAMFHLRLDFRPDFAKTLVYVRNVSPHPISILTMAYLHLANGELMTLFESELRIPWGSFQTFSFHSSYLSKVGRNFALILIGRLEKGIEVVEQYYLQVSELSHYSKDQLGVKKPPIHCAMLNSYPVPAIVQDLYKADFSANGAARIKGATQLLDKLQLYKDEGLNPQNYIDYLNVLNQIEDFDLQVEYTKYRINKAKLVPGITEKFYRLTVDQFETAPTLLDEECGVKIIIPSEFEEKSFAGTIHKIHPDYMVIHVNKPLDPAPFYLLIFELNRMSFQLEYFALNMLNKIDIERLLFPTMPAKKNIYYEDFAWSSKNITTNSEQMAAVRNIVNRTAFPAPYILFGPPGTGKTSTLVEAIYQIWKLQPKANVLVSASSNFACDEFTKRLLEFVPASDVFRFLSKACEKNVLTIDEAVIGISNLASGTYTVPSWHDIYNSRVVIATVTMCGRLSQAKIDPNHFSYIFIDEAGSTKEVSSLIPIAGIGTNGMEITASVILSGDPKQLGPVIRYGYLRDTVQQISMLERLMNHDIYRRDLDTGKYNTLVLSKLKDNYRSHRHMLQFSNYAFYDGDLRSQAPTGATCWAIGWSELPRKNFPLFFHSVRGITEKDAHSSSLYNRQEADQIIFYVRNLLSKGIRDKPVGEHEIGIISPYTKQVHLIQTLCKNNNWDHVEVGSTEQYQGREKPIILISTVRSGTSTVGFLCNEKRLNVAITRARALMIIVGNPDTLQLDLHWYSLLKYCVDNNGFKGSQFALVPPYKQTNQGSFLSKW